MTSRWIVLALACAPALAAAQSVVVADVGPGSVGRHLEQVLALPGTTVRVADSALIIPRDQSFAGSLVVVGPRVYLAGSVRGDVIVVGGDLHIRPGARVSGRAVAIGGAAYPSILGMVDGGLESHRDFTYVATPEGDQVTLRYLAQRAGEQPMLRLPGVYGLRIPTYDRTNGLSVAAGPLLSIDTARIEVEPVLSYRSQLGTIDPGVGIRVQAGRRTRLAARAERGSFSNEEWIIGRHLNTLNALLRGKDVRNWYRADRGEATMHQMFEGVTTTLEPYLGGRWERAWSARPDSGATGGPWSLLGRGDSDRMLRPNPRIDRGTIASALAGARTTWKHGDVDARLNLDVEVPFVAPGDRRFVQTTVDARVQFPTFGSQRYRLEAHVVTTTGDTASRQRWSYLGGTGSIPMLELLEVGGDQLLMLDSRYEIPVERVILPFVGSPLVTLRHIIGGAAVDQFPDLVNIVGVRLSLRLVRAEVLFDVEDRETKFVFGLSLSR